MQRSMERLVETLDQKLGRLAVRRGERAILMGKPWENHRKTIGKWWLNGI